MRYRIVLAVIVVATAFAGACHGQQNWLSPGELPFMVDPTISTYIVAVRIEAEPSQEIRIEQLVETHQWPIAFTFSGLPSWGRQDGPAVFLSPVATDMGIYYFQITATDEPPFYIDPRSVTGTWVVEVLPTNPGPVLVPFVR